MPSAHGLKGTYGRRAKVDDVSVSNLPSSSNRRTRDWFSMISPDTSGIFGEVCEERASCDCILKADDATDRTSFHHDVMMESSGIGLAK